MPLQATSCSSTLPGAVRLLIETSVYHLRRFCNELSDPELDAITSQEITEYFASLRVVYATATIRRIWATLRPFFNWTVDTGLANSAPDRHIPLPRLEETQPDP